MEELLDSEGDLERPAPVDAMRGTVVAATRGWLRERRREEEYFAILPPRTRDAVVALAASDWLPVDHARTHYDALEAMITTQEAREVIGGDVSNTVNGVVLKTISHLAGTLGATPITALKRSAKMFARNFRGGVVRVYRIGDADVRFEVHASPLASSAMHRDSLGGAIRFGSKPFAATVRVAEMTERRRRDSFAFRIKW